MFHFISNWHIAAAFILKAVSKVAEFGKLAISKLPPRGKLLRNYNAISVIVSHARKSLVKGERFIRGV